LVTVAGAYAFARTHVAQVLYLGLLALVDDGDSMRHLGKEGNNFLLPFCPFVASCQFSQETMQISTIASRRLAQGSGGHRLLVGRRPHATAHDNIEKPTGGHAYGPIFLAHTKTQVRHCKCAHVVRAVRPMASAETFLHLRASSATGLQQNPVAANLACAQDCAARDRQNPISHIGYRMPANGLAKTRGAACFVPVGSRKTRLSPSRGF